MRDPPPLDDSLVALLRHHGFRPWSLDHWVFETEVKSSRYVTLQIEESSAGRTYIFQVEEWRGGEGYEEDFRIRSLAEAEAAVVEWARWASEPFVMTRPSWWQKLWSPSSR
jgi:hypothetical protein